MTLRLWWAIRDPENWPSFDGWQASQGVDPLHDLSPDRFFSLVYYYMTRYADESERKKFDARLWVPPKGEAPEPGSPWSPEAEKAAFQGLASALNIKPK